MRAFRELVDSYIERFSEGSDLVESMRHLITAVGYTEEVKRRYPDAGECETRLGAVEQLISAAGSYQQETGSRSLAGFLDATLLDQRDQTEEEERNGIFLMTLHAAKGLEFPHVYLTGMEEGLLPHQRSIKDETGRSIDEERRLCYVGITRAQTRLTMTLALTRRKWGKPRESFPSRFLFEMTGQADNPRSPGQKSSSKRRRKG